MSGSMDTQIELDDFARSRWIWDSSLLSPEPPSEDTHPAEIEAQKAGMCYIKPPKRAGEKRGNVGCFGYGAGVSAVNDNGRKASDESEQLAMATMDAVVAAGGRVGDIKHLR